MSTIKHLNFWIGQGASYRVQCIAIATGAAAGAAAAIAAKGKIQPRDINVEEMQKALGITT